MFGQGILRTVRLAIVATPPLLLVSVVTLGLALRPHHGAVRAPVETGHNMCLGIAIADIPAPPPTCSEAHTLVVYGHITGGATHVRLAGPVIYTDVTSDPWGNFQLRVPVEGDLCSVLPTEAHAEFAGDGMTMAYDIRFER